ncbi:hypothetical protein [Streptomyces sp. NPDC056323]|uniref:protein kinase domain-containing protein n=1 Tax=unclassified Streptomyces TaxID=2593676 RepID=UPI0035DC9D06
MVEGIGTFRHLSPEQARGGPLSAAADVWGIGVTLYEVVTGDTPFGRGQTMYGTDGTDRTDDAGDGTGDDPCDGPVRYPQLEQTAPPVGSRRRLPRDLAAAIDACLYPDPAARPTVPELAEALGGVLPRQARHRPGDTS